MKLRYKIIGVVGLLIVLRSCFQPDPKPDTVRLPDNANAITVVTPTKVTTVRRNALTGKQESKTTPNYGHGTTTVVLKDGTVEVKVKDFGIPNDFGLSLSYNSIGVANEFVYWRRLALVGGSQFLNLKTQRPQLNLWVGIGYRLPFAKFSNVSLYTGIDTDRHVAVGAFLRLGNS